MPEQWLPASLAVIAGMVDLTSFVSLGGIFTAHITGNLVVMASAAVRGGQVKLGQALAVPVFIVSVAAVWFLVRKTSGRGAAATRLILAAQFLLLVAVLVVSVVGAAAERPAGLASLAAVLLAASAMAAQNALLHLQVPGSPSTAVMTGNLVGTVIYGLDTMSGRPDQKLAQGHLTGVVSLLAGFLLGCTIAAAVLILDRNWGWALPAFLAGLVAVLPWRLE